MAQALARMLELARDPSWGRVEECFAECPYLVSPLAEAAGAAILDAFYPGEQQGHVMADILLGRVNPSGRLPVSVAQSTGHIPTVYDYLPAQRGLYRQPGTPEKTGRDYAFSSPDPLWSFGFGLGYTTFRYDALKIETPALEGDVGGTSHVLAGWLPPEGHAPAWAQAVGLGHRSRGQRPRTPPPPEIPRPVRASQSVSGQARSRSGSPFQGAEVAEVAGGEVPRAAPAHTFRCGPACGRTRFRCVSRNPQSQAN